MIQFLDADLLIDLLDDPATPARESFDPQSLGELADSMAQNSLLQPIGARGPSPEGRYEVVWGHRRTMAARLLTWTTIRARVCTWDTDPLVARAAENLHRTDLNPREEARQIDAFRKRGKPLAEIARIFRRSVGWVESRVELLTWPEDLQTRVAHGELAFAVARLLAEVDHEGYRAELLSEAVRTNANAPTVTVWLAHYAADKDRILRNHETIEQMVTRREEFHMMVVCESCREQADSKTTTLLRICPRCVSELRESQLAEDREREKHRSAGGG